MPFTITWSEESPVGASTPANTLDTIIQNLKTAIRERMQFGGMYFPSDHDELSGEYSNVRMAEQTANPTLVSNKGFLFTKEVSSITELYYMDDAGQVTQLTSSGKLNDTVQAKTGDFLHSGVTTARTGWTNVTATYTGKFLRVGGTPLTTGGSDTHTHTEVGGLTAALTGNTGTNTPTHSKNTADAGTDGFKVFDLGVTTHTHSLSGSASVTGTSASGSNVPAYIATVLWQKD